MKRKYRFNLCQLHLTFSVGGNIGHPLSLFVHHHIKVDVVLAIVDFQVDICLVSRLDR